MKNRQQIEDEIIYQRERFKLCTFEEKYKILLYISTLEWVLES